MLFNYLLNYLHNIIFYYILSCILDEPICSINIYIYLGVADNYTITTTIIIFNY